MGLDSKKVILEDIKENNVECAVIKGISDFPTNEN